FRQNPATAVPLLPQARHLFVTASLTRDPNHPLGRLIGDGLVLTPSGRGESRARCVGFNIDHGLHVGGASHFTLLNDDDVYSWLLEQLRP
ncbi:alpha/beta hydrolase, partial [Mycobacterium tuberculosis]|nr:alpha/beta hydrolase [Mycobacterium tuberculosis]